MNFFACSRGRSAAHTASRSASAKTINSSINISPQSSGRRFFPRIARILWKTHGGRFSPATNSFEMPLKISPQNTATPIPITMKTSPATSAICTRNTKQNNASPQKSLQNSPENRPPQLKIAEIPS